MTAPVVDVATQQVVAAKEASCREVAAKRQGGGLGLADSWAFPQGSWRDELPVDGAWLYNARVRPAPLPSGRLKLLVFPLFWVVCLGFHGMQRRLQLATHAPGEPGQTVHFERTLPGRVQVGVNVLCVVALSAYSICAYLFHQSILERVLNPLFTPRTWLRQVAVAAVVYAVALFSSFHLEDNWVAAAAGLFLLFGYGVCGRTVQVTASQRGQIGLGPSRHEEDAGRSFHVASRCLEAGVGEGAVQASLLGGDAGRSVEGNELRFATVSATPFTIGDDAVLVERSGEMNHVEYRGPCGRANVFRLDFLLVLLVAWGLRLPAFLIGGGGFNQCAGLVELVTSLLYVPVGYTCFAVFGFRVGLACGWSRAALLVLTFWPIINLVLGGKGCATFTQLVTGEYLPEIWHPSAERFAFGRGFASCSEGAYALGGETLLVASTTIAAWVHIMSNFSFLFGFVSGALRTGCSTRAEGEDVVTIQ